MVVSHANLERPVGRSYGVIQATTRGKGGNVRSLEANDGT